MLGFYFLQTPASYFLFCYQQLLAALLTAQSCSRPTKCRSKITNNSSGDILLAMPDLISSCKSVHWSCLKFTVCKAFRQTRLTRCAVCCLSRSILRCSPYSTAMVTMIALCTTRRSGSTSTTYRLAFESVGTSARSSTDLVCYD